MPSCQVCSGNGRLLLDVCPLCDGVLGWPDQELGYIMAQAPVATIARGPMPAAGLTLLSWNIFNPDTIGLATQENPHYNHLSPEERFWEHRFPKIIEEIRIADADVVCLQEINKDLYGDIKQALDAFGYDASTHKRMQRNSLAIFYKKSLSKVWERNVKVKGFEKTLAIGLVHGDRTLAIVTCHLEGHPQKSFERVEQLAKTLAEIRDLPHDGIMVAGDFNAPLAEDGGKKSGVSYYMSSGNVPGGATEWGHDVFVPEGAVKSHDYAFSSAYAPGAVVSIAIQGEEPALIDHIWYSGSLDLVGVRDVFLDKQFHADLLAEGLPNLRNPSDHMPLGAVFR